MPVDVLFWSDSTTVLQWLKSPPNRWKTFVANRISNIQTVTKDMPWRHVPGVDNPADELSRGLQPAELINRTRWWSGPDWLRKPPTYWPHAEVNEEVVPEAVDEQRKVALVSLNHLESFVDELFSRFSAYSKLRRVLARCLKFHNLLKAATQGKTTIREPRLTTDDLRAAEFLLVRLAQSQLYSEELDELGSSSDDKFLKCSPLKWLNPHLCKDGIIRVGGRLRNAEVAPESKHPIILAAKHPLSKLLAKHYHKNLLHAGPQLMLTTMGQKYWITGARNLARSTYHKCIKCFRSKPKLIEQSTADLPKSRVTANRPFEVSGVDYCGPVYIKSPVRNRAPSKAYISIFVCFSTRAVHIELVSDLSAQAFLAALRRFVARRGRIRELHSDNGTAFKGAANALNHIYRMLKLNGTDRDEIFNWCADNEIIWRFIPPRAPHFGGLWEAAVKSVKHHLLREIGHVSISMEDMTTLLAQIEMCLNSRPLTPIPSDPGDLEVLTPGHFLVGSNLQAVPEACIVNTPDNRLNHWQQIQKMFQRIWARWYPEYLTQLQSRASKGCKAPIPVEIGRVVVLKEDNAPPVQWPLAIITKVHPGKDGVVRVVTLKTAAAEEVVRPVARIAVLPIPSDVV